MVIPGEVVTAAGFADYNGEVVCDFITEDLLRAALEAAAPHIAARALEEAADAVDETAERLKLNKAAVSSDWIRNRATALRGEA